MGEEIRRIDENYSLAALSTSSTSSCDSEELRRLDEAPAFWKSSRRKLSKQLSMCETPRDVAWERRRRQIVKRRISSEEVTDEDLNELKGSIELGFGFNEEEGQRLCNTLPALDLYFAVNRQLWTNGCSTSPLSSPNSRLSSASLGATTSSSSSTLVTSSSSSDSSTSLGARSSSFGSPISDSDGWKICSPGDNPQQVKTKLRHWAQAVACSVMQSF